jgi:multidrug resistance efflux pump
MKLRASIILSLVGAALLRAQDDLPKHIPGEVFDFEPKLMLDGSRASIAAPSPASPDDRLRQCQDALRQAEQRAVACEQLFKEGVLAKVELEARFMRIVQARKELADATLDVAAAHADAVKKSLDAHAASQSDLAAANAALKTAHDAAIAASAAWDQAQIDAANLDLERKRKLYSEGVGSRHELQVAEDRVVLLSGTLPK